MNVIHSLVYIRDNILEILSDNYDDHILNNEIKRILDMKDPYYINSLENIVSDSIEEYTVFYYRENVKHSENWASFNKEEFKKNKENEFWNKYLI
jgi:hypothetical protein